LLDRIDLHVDVPRVSAGDLVHATPGECSAEVAARVIAARSRQLQRQGKANAQLEAGELEPDRLVDPPAIELLERAMHKLRLSARAYHRVLRVALTIADLAGCARVGSEHVAEAVTLRQLDRRTAPAGDEAISR
jgi:magnesium chelatase family protein